MSKQKTHQMFAVVAIAIMVAVAASILVYAYILATYYGQTVHVVSVEGQVWYCATNSNNASDWTATIGTIGNGTDWYAKFNTTAAGYSGEVTLTWTLQKDMTGTWTSQSATQTTTVTLTGASGQNIYASSDGLITGNQNWGASTTSAGDYRIKVVATAS